MEKIFSYIEQRPAPQWVCDRVEESWAVLENSDTREVISLPLSSLPKNTRPGSTLVKFESKWYINEAETTARAKEINKRFAAIKARTKGK
ncbi:MAG: DUF3006 domain-containing protein [Defluviitaleaceae bacterium]|nr:DUF3006 domain-containing protein [Defluviitaleaceae bacterium]